MQFNESSIKKHMSADSNFSTTASERICLLGGSFDPVHLAHIELAKIALSSLRLTEVQIIPASQPWQKHSLKATPEQRCAMIELAIAGEPRITLNRIETNQGGKTYTINTLHNLPKGPRYVWLLGSDQLANFCTWKNWRAIIRKVDLIVSSRLGTDARLPPALAQLLSKKEFKLDRLPFNPPSISSSDIRQLLSCGKPTDGLLLPKVRDYITTYNIY